MDTTRLSSLLTHLVTIPLKTICTSLVSFAVALAMISCTSGIKDTDPHLIGSRNMDYDHLIVPGTRIGPVQLNGSVKDAVGHLGEPSSANRSTFRGPGYTSDEVGYIYQDECIGFTWQDSGVDPQIENGYRGINVWCSKWSTAGGLHVGSSLRDVIDSIGQYCEDDKDDGRILIASKSGIWYWANNRNSPISSISVIPESNTWGGMCKDN